MMVSTRWRADPNNPQLRTSFNNFIVENNLPLHTLACTINNLKKKNQIGEEKKHTRTHMHAHKQTCSN